MFGNGLRTMPDSDGRPGQNGEASLMMVQVVA